MKKNKINFYRTYTNIHGSFIFVNLIEPNKHLVVLATPMNFYKNSLEAFKNRFNEYGVFSSTYQDLDMLEIGSYK